MGIPRALPFPKHLSGGVTCKGFSAQDIGGTLVFNFYLILLFCFVFPAARGLATHACVCV